MLLALQLTACGFHLRGSSQIANRYNPLFVVNNNLSSEQLSLLRKELVNSSAELTENSKGANQLLVTIAPLNRRDVASSDVADVELVQLTLGLQFSVQSETGKELLSQRELQQRASVQLDKTNLLAQEQTINTAEKRLLRRLMQSMISQLSR